MALDGSFGRVRALLERIPPEALDNPELAALLAYAEVIRPSLESAEAYLAIAERRATEVPEERRAAFQGLLATARLTLARWRGDHRGRSWTTCARSWSRLRPGRSATWPRRTTSGR